MEPMALGSPTNSPSAAGNSSTYLPAFLIGEPLTPVTQRNTNLSPTKQGGRTLAFGSPPTSPASRSRQFNNVSPTSNHNNTSSLFNSQQHHHHQQQQQQQQQQHGNQNLNASVSGPPIQGLFDSLRHDRNLVGAAATASSTNSPRTHDRPMSPTLTHNPATTPSIHGHLMNDSIFQPPHHHSSPAPRNLIPGPKHNFASPSYAPAPTASTLTTPSRGPQASDFWITVFGFPQSATGMILSHFSQCGTIVDKLSPVQNNGNWVHLRFTSRLECDKALNYNEKILNNYFMIGVTRCRDTAVLEREQNLENNSYLGNSTGTATVAGMASPLNQSNLTNNSSYPIGVRPLAHTAYKAAQSPIDVAPSPNAPSRSTGIVDKAMDFFFGW